jgi:hypothetical protein
MSVSVIPAKAGVQTIGSDPKILDSGACPGLDPGSPE